MTNIGGKPIYPSEFAREVRDEFRVERMPIAKRRRNWRVVKHHIDRPGCFMTANAIFMHPDLIAKLPKG